MTTLLLLAPVALAQAPGGEEAGETPRLTEVGSAFVLENEIVTVRFPGPEPTLTITPKANTSAAGTGTHPFTLRYDEIVEYADVNGDGAFAPGEDERIQALDFSKVQWETDPLPNATGPDGTRFVALGLAYDGPVSEGGGQAQVTFVFNLHDADYPMPTAGAAEALRIRESEIGLRVGVLSWEYEAPGHYLALVASPAPEAPVTTARIDELDPGVQAWVATEETWEGGLGHVHVPPSAYVTESAAGNASLDEVADWRPRNVGTAFHRENETYRLVFSYDAPGARMVSHGMAVGPHGRITAPEEAVGGPPLEGAPFWLLFLVAGALLAFLLASRTKMRGPEGPR